MGAPADRSDEQYRKAADKALAWWQKARLWSQVEWDYADGNAPELDQIVSDPKANVPTRLVCEFARFRAGESLTSPYFLEVLKSEKVPEHRLLAALALGHCGDREESGTKLIELLDEKDQEIQLAAVFALQHQPDRRALQKLAKILETGSPQASGLARDAIINMGGAEAVDVLAGLLQKTLSDPKKATGGLGCVGRTGTRCRQALDHSRKAARWRCPEESQTRVGLVAGAEAVRNDHRECASGRW